MVLLVVKGKFGRNPKVSKYYVTDCRTLEHRTYEHRTLEHKALEHRTLEH